MAKVFVITVSTEYIKELITHAIIAKRKWYDKIEEAYIPLIQQSIKFKHKFYRGEIVPYEILKIKKGPMSTTITIRIDLKYLERLGAYIAKSYGYDEHFYEHVIDELKMSSVVKDIFTDEEILYTLEIMEY